VTVLCAVGDLLEDVVVWLAASPQRATDTGARIVRQRGGSAANVAAFAAAIGGVARFVGRVGDDEVGGRLIAVLAAGGVEVRVERVGRTGTIVVLVEPDGERTMLSDRGAATELSEIGPDVLDGVTVVHLPAYSLTVEPIGGACRALAAEAHRRRIPLSVDTSSVAVLQQYGPERFRTLVAALAPTVVFAAADEAAVLDWRCRAPVPLLVVKDGPRPVRILTDGRVEQVVVTAAEEVADTTGAGDAFAAGFLGAWVGGTPPFEAARRASDLAAAVLSRPGATW
jgi:sugar/nucleoside kinase (ribokinase family)